MIEAQSRQGTVLNTFGNGNGDRFGATVSISNDGNRVAVMAPDNGRFGTASPQAEVYELQGGNWVKLGETLSDYFSSPTSEEATVALSGNGITVATGEPAFNTVDNFDAGRIQTFRLASGSWTRVGSELTGSYEDAQLGKRIELLNNGTLMMTANFGGVAGDPRGAFNYNFTPTSWGPVGTQPILQSSNEVSLTGIALSSQGDIVGIGLDKGENAPGEVQLFRFLADWVSKGNLSGSSNGDGFGESIAMADIGKIVAVGAPKDGSGKVRVYDNSNTQIGSTIEGSSTDKDFGYSIDISEDGTRIVIGAPQNDPTTTESGSVYVYDFVGSDWALQYTFNGTVDGEETGQSVSLSDDGMYLAIGRPRYEAAGQSDAGQVDVFILDGSVGTKDEKLVSVEVFPNPATDQLTISGMSNSPATIQVFDAVGRVVLKTLSTTGTLEVSDLKDGYYFILIEGEEGVARIPFVKE